MSCCNSCGCNSNPCKNLSISDIAPLDYIQGVDANGCPKFQSVATFLADDQIATEVPYTPGNVAGVANVQAAIDALGTCCTTNKNAITALQAIDHAPGSDNQIAVTVPYTPGTVAGVANVQAAIDALGTCCTTNNNAITALQAIDHAPGSDNQIAATVPYTPGTVAGVASVQAAIDALGTCCTTNNNAITALQAIAHAPNSDNQNAQQVPIVTAFDGLLTSAGDVETALQMIDNWLKEVLNPGASLPIAPIADAGVKPLLNSGKFYFAETDDIIPVIGASGVVSLYDRQISAKFTAPTGQMIPPNNTEMILFPNTEYNTTPALITSNGAGVFQYNGLKPRVFIVSTRMMFQFDPGFTWIAFGADPEYSATAVYLYKNGGAWNRLWDASSNKNDLEWANNSGYLSPQGTTTILLNPGDTIGIGLYHIYSTPLPLFSATASGRFDVYLDIVGSI